MFCGWWLACAGLDPHSGLLPQLAVDVDFRRSSARAAAAFTESHRFEVIVFSFSFVSMHVLISFFISSMICWLFRSVLFSLHMFVFLIVFFL